MPIVVEEYRITLTCNDEYITYFWNKTRSNQDGAAGKEIAIAAGAVQDCCGRDGTASADVGSSASDI